MNFGPSLHGAVSLERLCSGRGAAPLRRAIWDTRAARVQPGETSSVSSQKIVRGKIYQVPRCPCLWDERSLFPTDFYLGEF